MDCLLSVLSLYNYDNTLFDNLHLPNGVDKQNVINNLLLELAELEVIYPNPYIMKNAIGFWSTKELPIWEDLYSTTKLEYNPIWNQFRNEKITKTETRNLETANNQTRNLSVTDNETRNLETANNETRNLSVTENETRDLEKVNKKTGSVETANTNTGTDTTKEYISGFNEQTMALHTQSELTKNSGNTVTETFDTTDTENNDGNVNKEISDTGTLNKSITDTGSVNKSITDTGSVNNEITDTGTVTHEHEAKFEGHTGIISVQGLILKERDIVQFNIIDFIIDSFKKRFCIMVY